MLAQICQFLAVDSSNFPENEHIIIGDLSNEGGFMIHYFLNLCQKQNRPLCFVSISQSFNHYNTVAQKLGTNLLSARDENKNLIFIEVLKILEDCILPVDVESRHKHKDVFEKLIKGDSVSFISFITDQIRELTSSLSSCNPVVIIDDLSFLLNFGIKTQQINNILLGLHQNLFSGQTNGSLISYIHLNDNDRDDDAEQVFNFSSHLSTLRIKISDLKTGYCKEVNGQVCII